MLVHEPQAITLTRRQSVDAAYCLVQAIGPHGHGVIVSRRRSTARCSQPLGRSATAKSDEIFQRSTAPSMA